MRKNKLIKGMVLLACSVTCLACGVAVGCSSDQPKGQTYVNKELVYTPTVKLDKTTLTLEVGVSYPLEATVEHSEQAVAWASSNASVATVATDGTVTAHAPGEAKITATIGSGENAVVSECTVTVVDFGRAPTLYLNYTELTMKLDDEIQLLAEVRKGSFVQESTFTTESANDQIVTVTDEGVLHAVGLGETAVTVFAEAEGELLSKTIGVTVRLGSDEYNKIPTVIYVPESVSGEEIYAHNDIPLLSPEIRNAVDDETMVATPECAYYLMTGGEWQPIDAPEAAGQYKAVYTYAGNDMFEAAADKEVEFFIYDDQGYLKKLLKMDSEESLSLFGWTTQGVSVTPAKFVKAEKSKDSYVECVPNSGREYWINLGSLIKVGDIHSISVDYYATWSWGSATAFNVNEIAKTQEQYAKLNLGNGQSSGAVSRQTKTFTKETLLSLGLTEDSYLEKILFDNYATTNWGLRICSIEILTNAEYADRQEERREELNGLLKMDSADILNITTTLNHYNNESNKATYVAATGSEEGYLYLKPYAEREFYIDTGSLYQLKDIHSITVKCNWGWQYGTATALCVNGAKLDATNAANYHLSGGTHTFTQAQLIASGAGLTGESYLEKLYFHNYGTVNGGLRIYEITIVTVEEFEAENQAD